MDQVEPYLSQLDSFLASAAQDAAARAEIAGALRVHCRQIVGSLGLNYPVQLAMMDMALVCAITAYEVDHSEQTVLELRECLTNFHVAVAAAYGPIELAAAA